MMLFDYILLLMLFSNTARDLEESLTSPATQSFEELDTLVSLTQKSAEMENPKVHLP